MSTKPIFQRYIFHFARYTQIEVEIFGESLFTYYGGFELQNLFKINAWPTKESTRILIDQEEGSSCYKCHRMLVEGRAFYFIAPGFFNVFVQNIEESHKMKIIFTHNRIQRITMIPTEPVHFFTFPENCSFSISKVSKTRDNDLAFTIINRKGRIFTILKGTLDLAIFCNRGIENWLTTYRIKKEGKKEIKKEK